MSGVVKAVKKTFKRVAKAAKKILPVALAVGAVVFTGGAALGLAGVAGAGWPAAAAGISAKLGATGVLSGALTGAITQAGYGAMTGAVISKVTGGSVTKGMQGGAMIGAAVGGATGAIGAMGVASQAGDAVAKSGGLLPGETMPANGWGPPNPPPGAGGGAGGAAKLLGEDGWLERNQTLVGNVVSGIGGGLLNRAESDARMDEVRERHRLTSQNYQGTEAGVGYSRAAPGTSGQSPTERFDPKTYGQWEYRFDPKLGRIVKAPVGG